MQHRLTILAVIYRYIAQSLFFTIYNCALNLNSMKDAYGSVSATVKLHTSSCKEKKTKKKQKESILVMNLNKMGEDGVHLHFTCFHGN